MKYSKEENCENCNNKFNASQAKQKFCSGNCRILSSRKTYGRFSTFNNLANGTVGALSELIVSADLLKKGYAVFRALSPSCFCDLIAVKDNLSYRVEVKTGYKGESSKITYVRPKKEKYDVLAVYISAKDEIYYLDNNEKVIEF